MKRREKRGKGKYFGHAVGRHTKREKERNKQTYFEPVKVPMLSGTFPTVKGVPFCLSIVWFIKIARVEAR